MATNFGSMTGSEFLRLMRGNRNPVLNMQIKPQQSSGLPSLLELYNDPEYGDLLEQIYPDTSEQSRKQALGSLLLGGIAPAALRFAQGVPFAEAIEPLPAAFAEAGLRAQQGKQATEQARREARFKLASDELTRRRAAQAEANKLQAFTPGSSVYRGGELAFTVPDTKAPDPGTVAEYVYTGKEPLQTPFGVFEPNERVPLGSKQLASLGASQALFKRYEKPDIQRFFSCYFI